MIQQARQSGMGVALYPMVNFQMRWDQWWLSAPRQDPGWWPVWFDQYRRFVLHHADLATQGEAQALILGGDWLAPALPDGVLMDGQPSGAPENAEEQWRSLLTEARSRYGGRLVWQLSPDGIENPPSFLDAVDQIYLTIQIPPGQQYSDQLGMDLGSWLDGVVWPFQIVIGHPILLGLELPASPDAQAQSDLYQQALAEAAQRDWIRGVVSRGYYPAAALQDASASVNGQPAGIALGAWFKALLGK